MTDNANKVEDKGVSDFSGLCWRGISTAPKDGRAIFVASAETGRAHIAKWNGVGDSWTDEFGGFEGEICQLSATGIWESGGGWFQPNEVTHWMPLPPPPALTVGRFPTSQAETYKNYTEKTTKPVALPDPVTEGGGERATEGAGSAAQSTGGPCNLLQRNSPTHRR